MNVHVARDWVFNGRKDNGHESGEDSLKGTTEPTTVTPIVSQFPSHNSSSDALQIENQTTDKQLSTSLEVSN